MSEDDTWWDYHGATVSDPTLLTLLPQRGVLGGVCANKRCHNEGSDWYHRSSGTYYCDECARHINERCLESGHRKVCELHSELINH